jgi:acetylornithine/succinyldiaminopimelate/putrescine aminotransferase
MENHTASSAFQKLQNLRTLSGPRRTLGLSDERIQEILYRDPRLVQAINEATALYLEMSSDEKELLLSSEDEVCSSVQSGFLNFYGRDTTNPYTPLAGRGPWIVTAHGAVVIDCGGYGMLALGHSPPSVLETLSRPQVMANIMTPNFSQIRFNAKLRANLGFTRGGCPFDKFICLNSGSEAVGIAVRLSDVQAKNKMESGGYKRSKFLVLKGAFHGRTDRPAQASDSSIGSYRQHLASFQKRDNLIVVPSNDSEALQAAFNEAESEGTFIEAMLIEPIQGEGNPGVLIDREFYDLARSLTLRHGSLLLADSIQAGLRGHGCLSIVDYPGFEDCEVPDMETWSKALNAGQYPLSVLGLNKRAAGLYSSGLYGNTMTTNPRALDVACTVMDSITDDTRQNVKDRGEQFASALEALCQELPEIATGFTGTGLLFAVELKEKFPVVADRGVELLCRESGLGIIHGGTNAIRFTPYLNITVEESDLVISLLREVLQSLKA